MQKPLWQVVGVPVSQVAPRPPAAVVATQPMTMESLGPTKASQAWPLGQSVLRQQGSPQVPPLQKLLLQSVDSSQLSPLPPSPVVVGVTHSSVRISW